MKTSLVLAITLASNLAITTNPAPAADIVQGLVAHWLFDGDLVDASGNGNSGSAVGDISYGEDHFGRGATALHQQLNEYVNIGSGAKPNLPLTVAAWVKLEGDGLLPGNGLKVFRNDSVNSAGYRWGVYIRMGPTWFYASIYDGYAAPWTRRDWLMGSEVPFADGQWHHVAAVIVGATSAQVYIDGVEQTTTAQGSGSGLLYNSGSGAIGSGDAAGDGGSQGYMDDVRIYSRALDADEILEIYEWDPREIPLTQSTWSELKAQY